MESQLTRYSLLLATVLIVLANEVKADSLPPDPSCTPADICTNDWTALRCHSPALP